MSASETQEAIVNRWAAIDSKKNEDYPSRDRGRQMSMMGTVGLANAKYLSDAMTWMDV